MQAGNPNMRKKATSREQKRVVLVLMLNSNKIFKISSIMIYNDLFANVFFNIMMKYRGEVNIKKKQA